MWLLLGTVGDTYDNAVIEWYWARMQVELLNRQRLSTRVALDAQLLPPGLHLRKKVPTHCRREPCR
jgi:hypothetical protein